MTCAARGMTRGIGTVLLVAVLTNAVVWHRCTAVAQRSAFRTRPRRSIQIMNEAADPREVRHLTAKCVGGGTMPLKYWLCVGTVLGQRHGVARVALTPLGPDRLHRLQPAGVNVEVANGTLFFRECQIRTQPCVPCDLPSPWNFAAVGGDLGTSPPGRLRAALTAKVAKGAVVRCAGCILATVAPGIRHRRCH